MYISGAGSVRVETGNTARGSSAGFKALAKSHVSSSTAKMKGRSAIPNGKGGGNRARNSKGQYK